MKLPINQLKLSIHQIKQPYIFVPILLIIFSFISTLLVVAQLGQSQIVKSFAQVTPPATKIMVVGDSISHGSAGDYTWRYRLWQHLASSGASVDFVGPKNTVYDGTIVSPNPIDHETMGYIDPDFDNPHDATAGAAIQQAKKYITGYVTAYTPDILLIDMGINDIVGLDLSGQQTANEMTALITNARLAKPDIKIVVSKLTPLVFADPSDQARRVDFNNLLPSLVATLTTQDSPIVLTDPTTGFDTAVDLWDGIHPTPSGEYKIAAAFANTLASSFGIGNNFGPIPQAPPWPLAPTNLKAVPISNAVNLTWDKVTGSNEYYIYYRNVAQGPAFTRLPFPVTETSFKQIGLVNGQMYEFAVTTKRGNFEGPKSNAGQATPSILPSINTIPAATAYTDGPYTYNRAVSFTDSDSTSWTATVNYGDGSAVEPATISNKTVALSHTYSNPGSFTVIVTVKDNQGTSGTQTSAVTVVPEAKGSINTLTPKRILDTRTSEGGHPAALTGGESMHLQILGKGGVPASEVSAVIVNVTVVPGATSGYLTLYPSGLPKPEPEVSNINFIAGTTVANQALVRVGENGKITIFNNAGNNHVLVDVQGWIGKDASPAEGKVSSFLPVRVLDTRTTTGALGSGQTITISPLTALNNQGIDISNVKAIIANITAVPNSTTNGYLTLYPDDPKPTVSNVNVGGGITTANLSLIPLKTPEGTLKIYNNAGSVHVIVDVQAIVIEGDTSGLQTVQPARILDTRLTAGGTPIGSAKSINLPVLGVGGIRPNGVSAVVLHITATAPTANSYLTVYPKGTAMPLVSSLNFAPGKTVSNNVIVPVGADGSISIYNNFGTTHAIVDVQGWVASSP